MPCGRWGRWLLTEKGKTQRGSTGGPLKRFLGRFFHIPLPVFFSKHCALLPCFLQSHLAVLLPFFLKSDCFGVAIGEYFWTHGQVGLAVAIFGSFVLLILILRRGRWKGWEWRGTLVVFFFEFLNFSNSVIVLFCLFFYLCVNCLGFRSFRKLKLLSLSKKGVVCCVCLQSLFRFR